MFNLKGKNAIITGGAGYLGRSMAEGLLQQGANVILFGRGQKIIDLREELQDKYRKCKVSYYDVDFYDTDKYKSCLEDCIKKNKTIDVLINNSFDFSNKSGFNCKEGHLENMSKEMFLNGMDSGIFWAFLSMQVIGFHMCKNKSGSIINISSVYGHVSPTYKLYEGLKDTFNPITYSIAKSGILALTRYCADNYGRFNVRVNSISPGMYPNTTGKNKPDSRIMKRLTNKIPMVRIGQVEDLRGIIVFLSSDASSYCSGSDFVVDGGFLCSK